jgi:hypothetical protein
MPPPKAINKLPRSAPARIISRANRSTLAMVLNFSPGGRNNATGGSRNEAQKLSLQSAQIGGDVSTKTRLGSLPMTFSMRGASVLISPLPATTSYFAVGVTTRMVCTLF